MDGGYGEIMRTSGTEIRTWLPKPQAATLVVSASNSLFRERADYYCDGVADQVEIQAAINACPVYGTVYCSEGTYNNTTKLTINKPINLIISGVVLCTNCDFIEITHATETQVKAGSIRANKVSLSSGAGSALVLVKSMDWFFDINVLDSFDYGIKYAPVAQASAIFYGGSTFHINTFWDCDVCYHIPAEPANVFIEGDVLITTVARGTLPIQILGGGYFTFIGSVHTLGTIDIDDTAARVPNTYTLNYSAGLLNLHSSSALAGVRGTKGARVYHNANQSIPNATETTLAFNSERYDTDSIHNTVTNNGRLTCKTPGKYLIAGNIIFDTNTVGIRFIRIWHSSGVSIGEQRCPPVAGTTTIISIATIYNLAIDDYVTLNVYQGSGGALLCVADSATSPEFMMQRIG